MRYFITGCTGFIGLHLCRRLLAEGHQLHGLVRNRSKLPADLAAGMHVVEGDLGLFAKPGLQLPEVDVFVHLAAIINGNSPEMFLQYNHQAVSDILDRLKEQKWQLRRFVLASSLAAAGPGLPGKPLTETDIPNPVDPYGEAKLMAEQLLAAQPFATTIFRPPVVIGPGDPAMLTVFKMVRSGLMPLPSGDAQIISYIDIDDLVDALLLICNDSSDENRIYFVTNELPVDSKQLAREIASVMGKKVFFIPVQRSIMWLLMKLSSFFSRFFGVKNVFDERTYRQMLIPSFVCTSALLTRETGWKARRTLTETIQKTVDGYRNSGWL